MNRCLNDNKEISDKAKYCSEACRKAYARRTKKGEQPGQKDPQMNPDTTRTFDFEPTRTDRLFEDSRPGYYNFSNLKDSQCLWCSKKFKSHLSLLRYCAPGHMMDAVKAFAK